jgi:hypothetical protein
MAFKLPSGHEALAQLNSTAFALGLLSPFPARQTTDSYVMRFSWTFIFQRLPAALADVRTLLSDDTLMVHRRGCFIMSGSITRSLRNGERVNCQLPQEFPPAPLQVGGTGGPVTKKHPATMLQLDPVS